jgi:hypothetical protein
MSEQPEWIERTHWSIPVPLSAYVEICGRDKTQTKRGSATDFGWGYDPDGEGNIHFYRVLSTFQSTATELQTKSVEVRLPTDSIVMKLADESTCGLMMIWWEQKGAAEFYKWLDTLQEDNDGE